MATETAAEPLAYEPTRHLFDVEAYEQMVDAGILTKYDHVELIDGEILEMAPIGSPHAAGVTRLNRLLTIGLGDRALVAVQNPARLWPASEPQPDLAVLRPQADAYASGHPEPSDILLLVEVADSSLHFDRSVKVPLYARHGVPEVWVVDVKGGAVEVHRSPSADRYLHVRRHGRGEQVSPEAFADLVLQVDDIVG